MVYSFCRALGWTAAAVCFAAAAALAGALILMLLAMLLHPATFTLTVLLLAFGIAARAAWRRRRAVEALGYVAQGVRLSLPLPRYLSVAEASTWGLTSWAIRRVRRQLEAGRTLGEAVSRRLKMLGSRGRRLVVEAEQLGALDAALARLSPPPEPTRPVGPSAWALLCYAVGVGWVMLLLVIFWTLLIAPKVVEIFADFGTTPSPVTSWLADGGQWMTQEVDWAEALGAGAVLLLAVPAAVVAGRLIGGATLLWWVPVLGGPSRDRGRADVFDLLAEATGRGVALPGAIGSAARAASAWPLRRQLGRWQRHVEAGQPFDAAARAASLPRLVSGLMVTSAAAGSLPEVFRFLQRFYDSRAERRGARVRGFVAPAIVLLMAVPAAAITLGMFQVLITLLWRTLDATW